LTAINFNLARMISPAIGGILIDQFGVERALWIAVALYLPNFILLAFTQPRPMQNKRASESFTDAFMIGLTYAWTSPSARQILMLTGIFSLSLRGILEILPVIADGSFGRGATGLGQLSAAVGAGALTAAILNAFGSANSNETVPRSVLWIAPFGMGAVAILGLSQDWTIALVSASILGFCGTFMGVTMQTCLQSDLPDEMRGRVMSIWVVVGLSSTAVGAILIATSAEFFGLPVSCAIAACTGIILLGWVSYSFCTRH
jgi:predicted MFS family arabinose efflux permease